jgi:hypothetical protein
MTSRILNARQARWGELLSRFRFRIRYRPGRKNAVADALSRKERPKNQRTEQILLSREVLEQGVYLGDSEPDLLEAIALSPISISPVMDRILSANRTNETLREQRDQATRNKGKWVLEDGLLLYEGRLVVPDDGDLRARLLDEIHRQPSMAHPGQEKTKRMLTSRYY